MDLSSINPTLLIAALMVASTPILLAAIGELIVEKSGTLNLGVEGMMITGAICGFAVTLNSGSPTLGFIAAAAGGAVLSLIFAVLVLYFLSNQVATGLALTLFGLGLAALIGRDYQESVRLPSTPKLDLGPISDIPVLGPILFSHDAMVYLSLLLVVAVWAFLKFTRAGLILRSVGENAEAAHALGYKVKLIRLAAIAFGGACAGLGGAYISMVRVPQWVDGITAGAGWIALAIVVFGAWRPGR
ncbi:MAG: ABC transporter permease, partial [Pseudomonadota bacterium]